MRSVLLLIALASCARSDAVGGGSNNPGSGGDGGDGGNGAPSNDCSAAIPFQANPPPIAGPTATIQLQVAIGHATGAPEFRWTVLFRGAAVAGTRILGSGNAIEIPVRTPGVYTARVQIVGTNEPCPEASATINVRAPDAIIRPFALRLVPPPSVQAPVQVQVQDIYGGGASDLGILVLSAGAAFHAVLTSENGGVPAYLQFTSGGSPPAVPASINELFTDGSISVDGRLPPQAPHSVTIVPATREFVPRRVVNWVPGAPLSFDRGVPVTGTVRGPGGAPLDRATVAISANDLPSTVAVTADGGFALRTESTEAGAPPAIVEVAPPSDTGLPRLVATVPLSPSLAIGYAAITATDLGGAVVQRNGAPLPGARVTVVGTLAAAGTITGASAITATGEVRVTGTTSGAGVLPSLRVPAAVLTAVIEAGPGDVSMVALDTRSGVPAVIEATPPQRISTAIFDSDGGGLPGAVVDLVPAGALASAGIPARRITAGPGGVIVADLPGDGRYELRFQDPLGRSAPRMVAEGPAGAIAASYRMPPTILVSGVVRLDGQNPIAGVAVQVLCISCSARESVRPMLEVVSDATGRFTLALPDPGTR